MRVWLGGDQAHYIIAPQAEHIQRHHAHERASREVLASFRPSAPARNSKRWHFFHSQGEDLPCRHESGHRICSVQVFDRPTSENQLEYVTRGPAKIKLYRFCRWRHCSARLSSNALQVVQALIDAATAKWQKGSLRPPQRWLCSISIAVSGCDGFMGWDPTKNEARNDL